MRRPRVPPGRGYHLAAGTTRVPILRGRPYC